MSLPKVQVLLSSYNGSKYLQQQIESILNQRNVDVRLLVRDDGSKKEEAEFLKSIDKKKVMIIWGNNIGSSNSFFELINNSCDCDYYSLSDQDDIWDEDKLICAIEKIKDFQCPAIYSSNARLVDEYGNFIKNENDFPKTTLGSAIVKDYATGCTVVFNKAARDILYEKKPRYTPTHDWWINLVVLSCGGISVYDSCPHISYRQHGNNLVGAPTSMLSKWKSRWIKFKGTPYKRDVMARELLELYGELIPGNNKKTLELISDYHHNKLKICFSNRFNTGNLMNNLLFSICLLLNKI